MGWFADILEVIGELVFDLLGKREEGGAYKLTKVGFVVVLLVITIVAVCVYLAWIILH